MTALASRTPVVNTRTFASETASARPAKRRLRITFGGLLFVVVNVLILLAGLNTEANLLLLLFGIGMGALTVNAVLPVLMLRRIEVDRIMPEGVVAERPFAIAYRVRNRRRGLRAWGLSITEMPVSDRPVRFPVVFIESLRPREEQRIETVGKCSHRSHLSLTGIRVACRYPFSLFACTAEIRLAGSLTVYPAMGRLRHDPWRTSATGQSQSARTTHDRENPEEFFGVREFREGDNIRWIHWRRSAHTGELVVREMIPLRQTRLVIMLDPWPASTGKEPRQSTPPGDFDAQAERIISAASTAICSGLEQGHRVGLICRCAEPVIIPPATGKAHRQRLLRELAAVRQGGRTPFDELIGRVRWSSGWNVRGMLLAARPQIEHERVVKGIGARAEAVLVLCPGTDAFESLFDLSQSNGTLARRSR